MVTIKAFDTVHTAAHTVDVLGVYLHVVEFAPVACHTGTEGMIVVYGSGARLARGAVETAKSNKWVHIIYDLQIYDVRFMYDWRLRRKLLHLFSIKETFLFHAVH